MSRSGFGALRRLGFTAILAATAAACSPASNALPTALPAAQPSAQAIAGPAAGAASALPSGALTDPGQAWPAFAACLRAHGAEIADPEVDDNGDPVWADPDALKAGMTPQIQAACGPIVALIRQAGSGRSRATYTYESELANAACMRQRGVPDWPDPDPNLAGGMPEGFDKADPTVYAALVACEHVLVEAAASPSPAP